ESFLFDSAIDINAPSEVLDAGGPQSSILRFIRRSMLSVQSTKLRQAITCLPNHHSKLVFRRLITSALQLVVSRKEAHPMLHMRTVSNQALATSASTS